jgi:hypothetical protein
VPKTAIKTPQLLQGRFSHTGGQCQQPSGSATAEVARDGNLRGLPEGIFMEPASLCELDYPLMISIYFAILALHSISSERELLNMTKSRRDGLCFLMLGIMMFVLFGSALRFIATDSMADFRVVYSGAKCLLQHGDPYKQSDLQSFFHTEYGEPSLASAQRRKSETLYVNLPSTILFIAPFAMLPYGPASVLWMILTIASLILAAFLIWDIGAKYAPIISGGLIGLLLASSAIVLGNGNPAGIVVGLCAIAVWCLLKQRFVPAGILCLAISLAIKPHDAALVWLFFLLAGGIHRKRALQTLAVTIGLGLAATMWVSHLAPHWMPEMRSNLAEISARGGNNDPGPAGPTSKSRTPEVITGLQAVVSVFQDDPHIYNPASYIFCGTLLLVWSIATLRSHNSPALTWFALAAVASLTLLVTYHRAYDAKLLLLTVPACAILWAEGGAIAKVALLVNTAGLVFTGEIPLAILFRLTKDLHPGTESLFGKIQTVLLMQPASLILLVMGIFYLWIYVRRARNEVAATGH